MAAERRPRSVWTSAVAVLFAGALVVATAVPAGAAPSPVAAVPPAPVNPSDDEIQQSESEAQAAATEVGRLSGLVATTEGEIARLRDDMELKAELALKARVDLDLAREDAKVATEKAAQASQEAVRAGAAIDTAKTEAAKFAAASFRQRSVLGSTAALMDVTSSTDLLERSEMLNQVSASQLTALDDLRAARNVKANKDSDARAALEEAQAAQVRADEAKAAADQAQQQAAAALNQGEARLVELEGQLESQRGQYQAALASVEGLKEQRAAYDQWLIEKKAEEERLRKEAQERARKAAEAERKANEARRIAEVKRQQAEAAERAALQAAAEAEARAKAAREKAEKERQEQAAAIARQEEQVRAAREAANRAAREKAEAAALEARRIADQKAKAAKDAARNSEKERAAEKAAKDKAAAQEAERQRLARIAREKQADLDRLKDAKERADREKAAHPGSRGSGTGEDSFFQNCDAARAAGAAPLKKGDPGYRAALDPNGNGIACDAGTQYEPDGGMGGGGGGSVNVPSDGSRGSIIVNAALRWLGTQYAWGGGNSSGPTLGIRDGGTADRYGDYMKVGFDCSGLALYAWAQVGVSLPHYSAYQYHSGQHIAKSALQPGDLVFFANNVSDPATIHHVAIYMGDGQMIEAPQSGSYVKISPLRTDGYIGATRPGT